MVNNLFSHFQLVTASNDIYISTNAQAFNNVNLKSALGVKTRHEP